MQDLNPDMEDLLQRASPDYPLKNGADRWDEIAGRISQTAVETSKGKDSNPFVKYSMFLLLMLFSFLVLNDTKPLLKENNAGNKNAIESEADNANHSPFEPAQRKTALSKPQSPVTVSNTLPIVNINKIGFGKPNVSSPEMQAESSTDQSKNISNAEYADKSIIIIKDLKQKQTTSLAEKSESAQDGKKDDEVKNVEHKITPSASAEKPGLQLKKNNNEKIFTKKKTKTENIQIKQDDI